MAVTTKSESLDIAKAKLRVQEAKTTYELAYAASFRGAADLAMARYKMKNPTRKDLETIILSDPVVSSSRVAVDAAERALLDLKEAIHDADADDETSTESSPLADALAELGNVTIEGQGTTLKEYYETVSSSINVIESSLSDLRGKIEDRKIGDYNTETENRVCEYASLYYGELIDYENHLAHIKWLLKKGTLAERLVDDEIKKSRRLQGSAQKLIDLTKIILRGY